MRIGILGAGQLGRMLALAGTPLGHSFVFFDQSPGEATRGIGHTVIGSFTDEKSLETFASECDVITYEFENVPCQTAHFLAQKLPVFPPPKALEVSQDRVIEKEFLKNLGVPTPRFASASSEPDLVKACQTIGTPCIVKTRRFGYDGKGQARMADITASSEVWKALGGSPLIVEEMIPFSRELSVITVRDTQGAILTYPLAHNEHVDGILHRTELPAPNLSPALQAQANDIATKIVTALNYVGILTVELFEVNGTLVANEIAPRVHNSGHITIDSVATSQFENHIRAISQMPLGSVTPHQRGVMYNLVGGIPSPEALSRLPFAKAHLYDKSPRTGRKVGHINLLDPTPDMEQAVSTLIATTTKR
jgi:5-(carboxyamino)imidazole ribonucleotide synthase